MKQSETMPFVAKTLAGLEEVLAGELKMLGATDICILKRAVSFVGDTATMYRSNYCCRTALHILRPVFDFRFRSREEFYDAVRSLAWEDYLGADNTLAVDCVMSDSIFTNSHYVSLLAKDAVADYFRDRHGRRPSVDLENPDVRIHVHVRRNECSVALDSSGGSLHRRGYRSRMGAAPLSETLAAGMIMLSGWDRKTDFYDPMCGSGTIVAEAAMIAQNIPAGYYRSGFGFMKWPGFDAATWKKVKEEAEGGIRESETLITGSDKDAEALRTAAQNLKNARLHKDVVLVKADFRFFEFFRRKGFIITNPPYGERIKPEDIISLYREWGDTLKRHCPGYTAWMISSHFGALKFVGLKPSVKIPLFNGPLECRFVKFELFEGSLKDRKAAESVNKPLGR